MPKPGKGYTMAQWKALTAEERTRIKAEHAKAAVARYQQTYELPSEKKKQYNADAYQRTKTTHIERVREYQQKKKKEQEEYISNLLNEIEYLRERNKRLEELYNPTRIVV